MDTWNPLVLLSRSSISLFLFILFIGLNFTSCQKKRSNLPLHPVLLETYEQYNSANFSKALQLCMELKDTLPYEAPKRLRYQVELCITKNRIELLDYENALNSLSIADSLQKTYRNEIAQQDTLLLEYHFRKAIIQTMLGKERLAMEEVLEINPDSFDDCIAKANIYDLLAAWSNEELNYGQTSVFLEKAEKVWSKLVQNNSHLEFRIPLGKSDFYFHQDLPQKSLEELDKAEDLLNTKKVNNPIIKSKIYYQKGLNYHHLQEYKTSLEHFRKAEELLKQGRDTTHPDFMKIYDGMGNAFRWLDDPENSLSFYQKALGVKTPNLPYVEKERTLFQHNIGVLYMNYGAFNKAVQEFDQCIPLIEKYTLDYIGLDKYLVTARTNRATVDYYTGAYKKAIELFQKAIEEAKETIGEKNSYIAQPLLNSGACHQALGEYYLEKGVLDSAQYHFEEGITTNNECLAALEFNAQIENPFKVVPSPTTLSYSLFNRAESYLGLYNSTYNLAALKKADYDYRLSIDLLDIIRSDFWEELSYLGFAKDNKIIYERAMLVNFLLHEKENDSDRLIYCFEMAEKSKSLLLLDVVRKNNIQPDRLFSASIIKKEATLVKEIRRLENRKINLKTKGLDRKNIDKELFDKRKEYQDILAEIKVNYKNYYNYKFNTKTIELKEAQNLAKRENATIIEYFIGQFDHFAMLISPDAFKVVRLDSSQLKSNITTFPLVLSKTWQEGAYSNDIEQSKIQIAQLGQDLHQKLIEPFLSYFTSDRLIIIPDDLLAYVPFDALITEKVHKTQNFHQHEYMVKKYKIAYANSISLLEKMQDISIKPGIKNWLGIAPSYKTLPGQNQVQALLRKGFGQLKFNQQSIQNIQQIVNGDTILGVNATKAKFLEVAKNYKVLHLSLHGGIDDSIMNEGFLVFHNQFNDSSQYLLYLHEVYPLELNTEMIVLSACETNLGALIYGEGILNLARAFSYAGTKSILTTLWKVDDQASMLLMKAFYENLNNNKTKDEALQAAKIELLGSPDYMAPFFWAAFKPIGDMSKINLN